MIIIDGNLIVKNVDKLRTEPLLRQAQNRTSSETSSEQIKDIVAYADLNAYDISNATILYGNVYLDAINIQDIVLVTKEVVYGC